MRKQFFLWLLMLLPACLLAQDCDMNSLRKQAKERLSISTENELPREFNPQPTNQLVNDYSNILTSQQQRELEQRLVAFDDSTSNQILVIITPTLGGDEIMAAGTRIATAWGVGDKDRDNGVLILLKSKTEAEPDGEVAILPGYGLEGALPDAFCKHIIDDEMIPALSDGDYYKAIVAALEVIEPVCRGEYSYQRYQQEQSRDNWIALGLCALAVAGGMLALGRHGNDDDDDSHSDNTGTRRRRRPVYWGTYSGGGRSSSAGGSFGSFGSFGGGSFGGGGAHGKF